MLKQLQLFFLLLLISIALLSCIGQGPIYALTPKTATFIPHQDIPEGLTSLRAEECGSCHQKIYTEWKTSLHSKAYNNPFFIAYHKKDKHDPSCLVCHTPLQNQLPQSISYEKEDYYHPIKKDNPNFDPVLRDEGVTCAACHVRDGIIYGPYSGDQMNAPHSVQYDPKFRSKEICLQCHQVPSKPFSFVKYGVCSTGEEYLDSPWEKKGIICQDCHMEKTSRPLAEGFTDKIVGKHSWPGGYSTNQLQKAFTFNAIREANTITVSISNSGAGHKVPTGDPDRYIELDFIWQPEDGNAKTVKSYTFKRQLIWQPIMFELYDNRLAAGESVEFKFTVKDADQKDGTLKVLGTYNVMTDRSLKRLKKKYELITSPEIHRPFLDKDIPIL